MSHVALTVPVGNALKGIALVMVAVFLLALTNTISKHLTVLYAVPFIMAMRYAISAGLLAAILGPRHGRELWRTNRTGLVILRGCCVAAGSLSMGLALSLMPMGETVAIIYLSPFLVMLIAWRFMGEQVSLIDWIVAACGFLGVILIVRPGSGLDPVGVGLSLFNALCAAAYQLLSRVLVRTESTQAMVFVTAIVGVIVFCSMALWTGPGTVPDLPGWLWLLLLGVVAISAHLLFTTAYREAPASTLAPIAYMHVVWAGILGWLVFAHVPDAISLLGMATVLMSGVVLAWRAQ